MTAPVFVCLHETGAQGEGGEEERKEEGLGTRLAAASLS